MYSGSPTTAAPPPRLPSPRQPIDEAVAGQATRITENRARLRIVSRFATNGRGVPVDPHHPGSRRNLALAVILTTLHSCGKCTANAYKTSWGLHGVARLVGNALFRRASSRGVVTRPARGARSIDASYRGRRSAPWPRCTIGAALPVPSTPHPEIFRRPRPFVPATLYRNGALQCPISPRLRFGGAAKPSYPGRRVFRLRRGSTSLCGLGDFPFFEPRRRAMTEPRPFPSDNDFPKRRVEWAFAWPEDRRKGSAIYCNPSRLRGGTHEAGLRALCYRYTCMASSSSQSPHSVSNWRGRPPPHATLLSLFIPRPAVSWGRSKERWPSSEASRLVESAVQRPFSKPLAERRSGTARVLPTALAERAEHATPAPSNASWRQDRNPQIFGCRQALPIARRASAAAHRDFSRRVGHAPAARPSRRGDRDDPGDPAAARQVLNGRAPCRTRCSAIMSSRHHPGARRRSGSIIARGRCATSESIIDTEPMSTAATSPRLLLLFFFRAIPNWSRTVHLFLRCRPRFSA